MRHRILRPLLATVMAVVALSLFLPASALAHESRDKGEFRLTVGFIVEPAFEGQKNGVDLRVMHVHKEGDKETLEPVEGLEKTLQVEITHVASNTSKVFALRTIFRDPGHYTNDLIFTAPGVYRFRFFGTIEGTQINEAFASRGEGGNFNDMQSTADLQFPERLPELREISSATKGAQAAVQQAQDTATQAKDGISSAKTLAIVGIVVGAIGVASGLGAMLRAGGKR
ncbi:MAG: hypothetical protein HYY01_03225 [Chloroflexi bacterium]|nr:hypothetical protein [Chloroflexota bacterium]